MTSSNGNIFRVTGHCAGNSPVPVEFPAQRPVTRSFYVIFDCVWINGCVNSHEAGDLRRYRAHYDVIVTVIVNHDYNEADNCVRLNTLLQNKIWRPGLTDKQSSVVHAMSRYWTGLNPSPPSPPDPLNHPPTSNHAGFKRWLYSNVQ